MHIRDSILLGTLVICVGTAWSATWLAGPDGAPMRLRDALIKAQDGDEIQLLPGLYKGEVGVIHQRQLVIRGIGTRPVIDAAGQHAEGKAIWVVRDGDVTIENIEFRGSRVPDGNGAGVRFEKGKLRVRGCRFVDNQNGLLTANFPDAELTVEDSEFAMAPRRTGTLPHLFYAGRIARVSVTGSRFHAGFEGHLIKSRARVNHIAYNLIVDGPGGGASYEIDFPNGGEATVIGNIVGQSAETQNPVLIAYGAEGKAWPLNRLLLSHNTLVSDYPVAWFLRTWPERLTEDTQIRAVNNITVGAGVFAWGTAGTFHGNFPALASMLVEPSTLAFELKPDSILRRRAESPRALAGDHAVPTDEFIFPIGRKALRSLSDWSPGALQR